MNRDPHRIERMEHPGAGLVFVGAVILFGLIVVAIGAALHAAGAWVGVW